MIKALLSVVFLGFTSWAHSGHTAESPLKAHLSFRNKSIHVHTEFTAPPQVGTESFLNLDTRSGKDHSFVDLSDDTMDVVLWMPDMGHGSAPTQINRVVDANGDVAPGRYIVRNIYFVMGGDWDIQVILTDKNGQKETQTFRVTLAGSGHHH